MLSFSVRWVSQFHRKIWQQHVLLKMVFCKKKFQHVCTSVQLQLLSSKLDSPVIETLESVFFSLNECFSNVLITRESNFDERSGQLNKGAYILKWLLTKYHLYTSKYRWTKKSLYRPLLDTWYTEDWFWWFRFMASTTFWLHIKGK